MSAPGSLQILLAAVPEDGMEVAADVPGESLQPEGEPAMALGQVSVRGRFWSDGDGLYFFTGRVAGTYPGPCDRCLKDVECAFDVSVHWTFVPGGLKDSEDEDESGGNAETDGGAYSATIPYSGDSLDLREQVWEEAVLNLPTKFPPLDEAGRQCSACGEAVSELAYASQLNDDASNEQANSGFAGLRELFPDLPEKPAEE